ncbi:MAG TPA: class I SAM-dependent methyltransferase [bacterium]|nr:class I SAM-dependent methyltransferase [bacterium]HPN30944.1 class I SAM-dependent methyltransferase [bacterium]
MADSEIISQNLIELYDGNDKMMNFSLKNFIKLSGIIKLDKTSKILDCGCGMGYLINHLKSYGFKNLTGLESCKEMAYKAAKITGMPVVCGDAEDLDKHFSTGSLDVVIFSSMLHHVPSLNDWFKIFKQAGNLIKPGGMIFIKEPAPTIFLKFFMELSKYKFFYIGFLKSRLKGYAEELDLHYYFFKEWYPNYKNILTSNGFEIVKDFTGFFHKVISAKKK